VAVDHSETVGAPVVMERNPTYNNLFGRIEKEALYGALQTDFTLIRGGSLHQANGGYLVLPARRSCATSSHTIASSGRSATGRSWWRTWASAWATSRPRACGRSPSL